MKGREQRGKERKQWNKLMNWKTERATGRSEKKGDNHVWLQSQPDLTVKDAGKMFLQRLKAEIIQLGGQVD